MQRSQGENSSGIPDRASDGTGGAPQGIQQEVLPVLQEIRQKVTAAADKAIVALAAERLAHLGSEVAYYHKMQKLGWQEAKAAVLQIIDDAIAATGASDPADEPDEEVAYDDL